MRHQVDILLMSLCAALLLVGCINDDTALQTCPDDGNYVEAGLAYAGPAVGVQGEALTRMSADVVQADGSFRPLVNVRIIPFVTKDSVKASDRPKEFIVRGVELQPKEGYFFYPRCTFMAGVNAALFYGRAVPSSDDKARNGSLLAHYPQAEMSAADSIWFRPDPIYTEPATTVPPAATAIAGYLSKIAQAQDWNGETDATFRALYQNFIGQGNQLLCGSYASAKQHVDTLQRVLSDLTLTEGSRLDVIRQAILSSIADVPEDMDETYPASIGLPDGAAVLRWIGSEFRPQTVRSEMADITSIDRYAYPAELYYYANSRLRTTADSIVHTDYASAASWRSVLERYAGSVVTNDTKSVAIADSIQYGVACLKVVLKKLATETLLDDNNQAIAVREGDFPLTGIIVSGQRPVGFDFKPKTDSDEEDYLVYDRQTGSVAISADADQPAVYTLLLQSAVSQKIQLLLEFENRSGHAFTGKDGGVVHDGTKFYLAGSIDPTKADKNGLRRGQAFTQDEFTTINVQVKGLSKAYNVMPNLLTPRLEMGIELIPYWTMTTPTNVELY